MSTIAQNLQTIATAKADIATSINNKGGSVTSSTPLSAYSAAIDAIPSGGGGGEPDWSEIGYSGAPQYILDGHAHAKTIYDDWDDTQTNLRGKCKDDTQLVYFPMVDTSNATNMNQLFSGCRNLEYMPLIDTSKVQNMEGMFAGCSGLTSIPLLDTSKVQNMQSMFAGCSGLTSIPLLNTSACTNMFLTFDNCTSLTTIPQLNTSNVTSMANTFSKCIKLTTVSQLNTSACTDMSGMFSNSSSLGKVEGLDLTSAINVGGIFPSRNTTLRYALLKNIGTPSGMTSYDFSNARNWGVADSTYTDARDSLVDSLLTYSFDRATAGYSTCTIKLYSNSKNQLTAQEISNIEAKGYTITT